MVEHVATGEEQNGNETDGGPQVAVLNDGKDVRRGSDEDGAETKDDGDARNPSHPVDRALHRRVGSVSKVSRQPGMDLFSRLRSV